MGAVIVSPNSRPYRIWEAFVVLVVLYTACVWPLEYSFFLRKKGRALSVMDYIANAVSFLDIVLTFFLAHANGLTKRWLPLDITSVIPYGFVMWISSFWMLLLGQLFRAVFNLFRLARLRRVHDLLSRLEEDIKWSYFWIRCARFILVALFAGHLLACISYNLAISYKNRRETWIGMNDSQDQGLWHRYMRWLYFAITTSTTLGYGNLRPGNTVQIVLYILLMFLNLALYSYLTGNMTSLAVYRSNQTRKLKEKIKSAYEFSLRNKLPTALRHQILQNLRFKSSSGSRQQAIIDSLPKAIRSSISCHLFRSLLDDVYLFRELSNDLSFQLVSAMKVLHFPKDEVVMLQEEEPNDFYIVVSGAVDLVRTNGPEQEVGGQARPGDIFGEIGVLSCTSQFYTARTKQHSQILQIDRATYLRIVHANVGSEAIVINNLVQRLEAKNDPLLEVVLRKLALGKMMQPLDNLYFAVLRGDTILLRKFLNWKLDLNDCDNHGRTPLHIAIAKGRFDCVRLLLEFNADLNLRDFDGNVPLWEALKSNKHEIIALLGENGANLNSGDVGAYACAAVEQDNHNLLWQIHYWGGDVTCPRSDSSTAIHLAVCRGNIEIVKFLLNLGSDVDKPDSNGRTARSLAEHQDNYHIKALIRSRKPNISEGRLIQSGCFGRSTNIQT